MFPSPGGAHPPPEELFAGRYTVDGALPWGGLVSYYRASSEGTPIILCVMPMDVSQSISAEAAFSQLAHGLGSIRSRTVPRVLDAGVIDGVPYLAFQDTRGTLLSDLLRDRPLSSLTVLRLATEVLDALAAGHAQALVHGDLTPQNIIVTRGRNGRLSAQGHRHGCCAFAPGEPGSQRARSTHRLGQARGGIHGARAVRRRRL